MIDKPWYTYLTKWQQELVDTSLGLIQREDYLKDSNKENIPRYIPIPDYSHIIFPMAKAYEGFLKKYLLDLKLIDEKTHDSRRFRIGRALNPDVHRNQRDEYWLYDDIEHICGKPLAKQLWQTWLECRNRVFHFFPQEKGKIDLENARQKLDIMMDTMDNAVSCMRVNN